MRWWTNVLDILDYSILYLIINILTSSISFYFFNVATRIFTIIYVVYILFLSDSAAPERIIYFSLWVHALNTFFSV